MTESWRPATTATHRPSVSDHPTRQPEGSWVASPQQPIGQKAAIMKSAITIKKAQDRNGESGACWELSNSDWIECELTSVDFRGKRTTFAGEHHTYHVDGYTLYFADIDINERFFSVKWYGTPRRAFEAAKRYSIEGPKS